MPVDEEALERLGSASWHQSATANYIGWSVRADVSSVRPFLRLRLHGNASADLVVAKPAPVCGSPSSWRNGFAITAARLAIPSITVPQLLRARR